MGSSLKKVRKIKTPKPSGSRKEKAQARTSYGPLSFSFVCPQVQSQSFGWRSRGDKKSEEHVTFREPYSTYFVERDGGISVQTDQVVALPEGLIAGKVMTLDTQTQLQYVDAVIKPLLVQYFHTLLRAPVEYFHSVGKSREELVSECTGKKTLIEVLDFIQTYIVRPSS